MTSHRRLWRTGNSVGALALATSGCAAEEGDDHQVTTSSVSASATASPCPSGAAAEAWPEAVPAQMPVPAGLDVIDIQPEGISQAITFRTTQSITDAAVFLALQLPAAGFTLHGGDSEENEVDQPFTGHNTRGNFKLAAIEPCLLQGVLVISASDY